MMKRRHLLQTLAALPVLSAASANLFAAPATNTRLLFIFLRGGYDATNLLVPISSPFYYESRPTIAIAKPSDDLQSALPLDNHWGLHPVLRDSIYPFFSNKEAVFIPFAGTDDLSRSHFETQDSIELGQPLQGSHNYQSGFLNRLAGVLNSQKPISFTQQLPLIFHGDVHVPNIALTTTGKATLGEKQTNAIVQMYQNNSLAQQVSEGFSVRADIMQEMMKEMDNAGRNAISTKGFQNQARYIAKLMKGKFNLGFIDVGGWDTHVNQGGASGYLAGRLDELGRGIATFAEELGSDWQNTVTVVISEFGRTFRENGNRGTDHGHGSVYWVLGGGIHGGKILGEQVSVEQKNLFQNRDFPVLNEYRSVLGGLFSKIYGLSAHQVDLIFPGAQPKDLGIV